MSALRKAGVWLGLIEDEDDRGYDDRYRDHGYRGTGFGDEFAEDDDEVDEVPVVPRARATDRLAERAAERAAERESSRAADRDPGRTERASLRSIARPGGSGGFGTRDNLALAPQVQLRERAVLADEEERRYQITTLHPTTYNEARTIGEHFRDGVPVIMNLTEMDEADAKRLVDFAAGLVFGLRGNFERVTNRVFLLSPANVQVTEADKAKIAEGGFFNQS
jgi:cell division inhibitor SepF